MLTVKCRTCGKKIIWNDFDGQTVKCQGCGDLIDVHESFKDNINIRINGEAKKKLRCPNCRGFIERRWFVKCPSCKRWVLGNMTMNSKVFFTTMIIITYLLLSTLVYFYIVR